MKDQGRILLGSVLGGLLYETKGRGHKRRPSRSSRPSRPSQRSGAQAVAYSTVTTVTKVGCTIGGLLDRHDHPDRHDRHDRNKGRGHKRETIRETTRETTLGDGPGRGAGQCTSYRKGDNFRRRCLWLPLGPPDASGANSGDLQNDP